ncbi:MAG: hypothetical protein PHY79_18620 [Anaerolineae bacterium]|jgi:hypothetical protein|nr:hypothetical protein [Anaerolineae bacterium]
MPKGELTTVQSFFSSRPIWRRVASALVLVLSVGFLIGKACTSWNSLRDYDWQIQSIYLLPSFGLFLVQLLVVTRGWQLIMDHLAEPIPFFGHLKIYGYTNLLRRIPAGMLWLVIGRMSAYKDRSMPKRTLAFASFLEMWLVTLTGIPLAAAGSIWLGLVSGPAGTILVLAALAAVIAGVYPAVVHRAMRLTGQPELRDYLRYRDTLLWALVYTMIWIIGGGGLYLITCLFGNVPIQALPQAVSVFVMSTLVAYLTIISPSGLGVKEVSITFLLGLFLPDPVPLLSALGMRIVWTGYDVIIGIVAWLLTTTQAEKNEKVETEHS